MSDKPRALTREECRDIFIAQVRQYVTYWANVEGPGGSDRPLPRPTVARLEGLAFSILCMLDGVSTLPSFEVIPHPHPSDQAYCEDYGENWWPSDVDIAGGLHDEWHKR